MHTKLPNCLFLQLSQSTLAAMNTLNPLPVSSVAGLKMESGGGMRRNPTLICTPIMADSIDKMVIDMAKAKAKTADLVEIRLDSLKSFRPYEDIRVLIKECPLPTLFTYRHMSWHSTSHEGSVLVSQAAIFSRLRATLGLDLSFFGILSGPSSTLESL